MKARSKYLVFGMVATIMSLCSFCYGPSGEEGNEEAEKGSINWLTIAEAEAKMKEEPKKIFIDVYTSWCHWCKVMDKKTFQHKDIATYINENYYAVKFDAQSKEDITYNGRTYSGAVVNETTGKLGYHEFAINQLNGKLSFPTTAYMDIDKSLITAVPGYWEANDFEVILSFIHGDHYKTTNFDNYKTTYKK